MKYLKRITESTVTNLNSIYVLYSNDGSSINDEVYLDKDDADTKCKEKNASLNNRLQRRQLEYYRVLTFLEAIVNLEDSDSLIDFI